MEPGGRQDDTEQDVGMAKFMRGANRFYRLRRAPASGLAAAQGTAAIAAIGFASRWPSLQYSTKGWGVGCEG
jgi:hypothetical protein